MTHFPQLNTQRRATRIQFGATIPALVKLENGQRTKGHLQSISLTGGCLQMNKPLHQGDLVEVAFQLDAADVQGMAEILPSKPATGGVSQPFRFIALDDDDHRALSKAVDSVSDQSFLKMRSSLSSRPRLF